MRPWVLLTLVACALSFPSLALAEGLTLNRFSPPQTIDDGLVVSRPNDRGHGQLGVQLHLDYANDPLVLELRPGDRDSEVAAVVSDQLVAHLGLSLGLWERIVLFAGASANALMEGEEYTDPLTSQRTSLNDGPGLGNAHFGARLRILGERDDAFGLGLQLTGLFPLAQVDSGQRFAGESSAAVLPELLLEVRPGALRLTANVGTLLRKDPDLELSEIDDELQFALGATLALADERLDLHAEVFGATSLADFGDRESTPVEFLAGGKYYVVAREWNIGLAGGAGLNRGIGAPDARVLATTRFEPQPEPEVEFVEPDRDSDGDGLIDPRDGCPTQPEDRDSFEDDDGCPDPDNDHDGVLDIADSCPLEPEDRDSFEDDDGCPDPDNDKDGLPDAKDQCPLEPEDTDDFDDVDGCPDPDNDGDGLLDFDDNCPDEPGTAAEQGCPKSVRIEEGRIVILQRVEFATNKDTILPSSEPLLEEVAVTIRANPQITKLRVEGHTDSRGRATKNMDLSRRRAKSVARWLIGKGIEAARLESWGCGETLPIADNNTKEGRQDNRRVEFHILEPAPERGIRAPEGCERD